jgi:hypothetical protein
MAEAMEAMAQWRLPLAPYRRIGLVTGCDM